jgi:hypothetical protein
VWKLSEGGYTVRQAGGGYIATDQHGAQTELADLAALIAFADAVYDRVWSRRKTTPSA